MGKTILCRCEDVTLRDIEDAFKQGVDDIETLKRYSGLSTGPCQGKTCITEAIRILARLKGVSPGDIPLTTQRKPLNPIKIELLAADGGDVD